MEKVLQIFGNKKVHEFHYESNYLKAALRDYRIMQRCFPELGAFNLFNNPVSSTPVDPMANGYASTVQPENGNTDYNTAAKVYAFISTTAGANARIWEMDVPYRYAYCWGSGDKGLVNNQGYGWFAMIDLTTAFDVGLVSLGVESKDRMHKGIATSFSDTEAHLADFTTLATATPTNNQTGMKAIPRDRPPTLKIALGGSRLFIDYTTVSVGTEDAGGFRLPITIVSG